MDEVIFIVGAELSGQSRTLKEQGYAGGFVNCFTTALDIPRAIDKCTKALNEDGYVVVIFDYASVYDELEFQDSVETLEAVSRLKAESHEVQYSSFEVHGH